LISGILGNLFSIAARLAGARGRGNEEACCKGVVELREWKDPTSFGMRRRVIAYAVRNAHDWRDADLTAVRREIGRINQARKELILDEDDVEELL